VIRKRLNCDLLANLDISKFCTPIDDKMVQALQARKKSSIGIEQQCVYYVKMVRKLLANTKTKRQFRLAVFGGSGLIGRRIINGMIVHKALPREDIIVCTRCQQSGKLPSDITRTTSVQETLTEYLPRLVIIACTGKQFEQLARELGPYLKHTILVCSVVAGVTASKVSSLLGVENAFCTSFLPRIGGSDSYERAAWELFYSNEKLLEAFFRACVAQTSSLGINVEQASELAREEIFCVNQEGSPVFEHFSERFRKTVCGTLDIDKKKRKKRTSCKALVTAARFVIMSRR